MFVHPSYIFAFSKAPTGFGKFLKVMEIENAIFQDLDSLEEMIMWRGLVRSLRRMYTRGERE